MNQPHTPGASRTTNLNRPMSEFGAGPGRRPLHAGATPYPPVPNDEDVGDEIPPQSDAGDDSLEGDEATPGGAPSGPVAKPS